MTTRFMTLSYAEAVGCLLLLWIHFMDARYVKQIRKGIVLILVMTHLLGQVYPLTLVILVKKNRPSGLKPQPRRR